jgi:hypothetical protein
MTGYRSKNGLIDRDGGRLSLSTVEGQDAFYANFEDYVRQLQSLGAKVFLIRGVLSSKRFNPTEMVTRSVTGFRIDPDFDNRSPSPGCEPFTIVDAIAKRTGATLLDPFPDVCGSGEGCPPFSERVN